jgi:hypothetical protein
MRRTFFAATAKFIIIAESIRKINMGAANN